MASPQEKTQCVLWYAESKFSVSWGGGSKNARTDECIRKWYQQFRESDSVLKGHSTR
jgi:hypothetical protein